MPFQKEDTTQKVIDIVSTKLSIPKENVSINASFKELGADSLDNVEIMLAFEDEFGIEIPDDRAEKIESLQDAIELLHAARQK